MTTEAENIEKIITKTAAGAYEELTPEEKNSLEQHLKKNNASLDDILPEKAIIYPRIEIGVCYEVPEGMDIHASIGGYTFASNTEGLFIVGRTLLNLTTEPIYKTSVVPLSKEDYMETFDKTLNPGFNVENDVVYLVQYGHRIYAFYDKTDSLSFLQAIVGYKSDSLERDAVLKNIKDTL